MGCKEEGRLLSLPTNATCNSSLPLRIEGLVKRFGQLNAVDGITLELRSGECLGLLGPNGAGKSTLIRSIVGRVIPDAGTILIFGAKADSTAARINAGMGPAGTGALPQAHLLRKPPGVRSLLRAKGYRT